MLKEIIRNPYKVLEIILSIYIIWLINIYIIIENGININIYEIIKLNINNIKILIFINVLFLIIFNSNIKYNILPKNTNNIIGTNGNSYNTMEYFYVLIFGLIGLNLILLSNDLIFLFIAIELFSISTYLLILTNISKNTSRMSIIYLIVSSLSSYTFLFGTSLIYYFTGSFTFDVLIDIFNTPFSNDMESFKYILNIGMLFILFGILIKIGIVPFNYWILRLYTILDNRILLYQLVIPKFVFVFLLYNLLSGISTIYINTFYYTLLFISILSVFVGSIGGLFNTYFKSILTYSSIFNMGFLLIGITNEFFKNQSYFNDFSHITFLEYFFIYSFNTLSIFFSFLLLNGFYFNNQILNPFIVKFNSLKGNLLLTYPMYFFFFIISIFSLIGIPPFAGFFAKLNIFFNIFYSYNPLWLFSILFLFISTLISACFYLKFLLYFFFPINSSYPAEHIITHNINDTNTVFISNSPISYSYFFSFFSLFLIFYPFLSNYLYPLYHLF